MASTEATATAVAAVVPFHCIICFEAFSFDEHPPVVLPCGHTYVCLPCSKRLKRCMECREPLFVTAPQSNSLAALPLMPMPTTSARVRTVGGVLLHPPSPPHPASLLPSRSTEPIPLPIPKNLVLLTMMEVAEEQARLSTHDRIDFAGECQPFADDDGGEDEVTRQNCARFGIEAISGSCGTYAVRDPEGLAVLPFDPRRGAYHHSSEEKKSDEVREPFPICQGQTVQVVHFEEGVAKLARGEGFVVASHQQLVKVGGPLERSCQLEGMLNVVESQRMSIQMKLDEIMRFELSLRRQVDLELLSEPNIPIVSDVPEPDIVPTKALHDNKEDTDSSFELLNGHNLADAVIKLPHHSQHESYFLDSVDNIGVGFLGGCGGCSPKRVGKVSPNTIVSCGIENVASFPLYRQAPGNDDDDIRDFAFGCGSSFFGEQELVNGDDRDELARFSFDSIDDIQQPRLSHTSNGASLNVTSGNHAPSPPLISHGATVRTSPSFDNINFRTGLSGHRGLSKTKASSPRTTQASRGGVRMMSEHKGIGRIRGSGRRLGGESMTSGTTPSPSLVARKTAQTHHGKYSR